MKAFLRWFFGIKEPCACCGKRDYHWGGCADQNAVFWSGVPYGEIPVHPTMEEILAQRRRLKSQQLIESIRAGIDRVCAAKSGES